MDGNVIPFVYDQQNVRVIRGEDGDPWFVGKDVCNILGLVNPTEALKGLDEDEKNTLRISEGINGQPGNPNVNGISESGLYTLIIRSNKPEARPFRRWVTHDVLPALRKHGAYVVPGRGAVDTTRPLLERARLMERSARIFRSAVSMAKTAGLKGRAAVIKGNEAARTKGGIDCLDELRIEYLDEKDLMSEFVGSRCILGEAAQGGIHVLPPDIYKAYRDFVEEQGFRVIGKQHFYEQLLDFYPDIKKLRESHGTREYFYGIGLDDVMGGMNGKPGVVSILKKGRKDMTHVAPEGGAL